MTGDGRIATAKNGVYSTRQIFSSQRASVESKVAREVLSMSSTAPTWPSAAGKGPVSDPRGADCTGIARPKPIAVLDIDSKDLATFDSTDALWLEKICKLL